jgi:hypothetical protein
LEVRFAHGISPVLLSVDERTVILRAEVWLALVV